MSNHVVHHVKTGRMEVVQDEAKDPVAADKSEQDEAKPSKPAKTKSES